MLYERSLTRAGSDSRARIYVCIVAGPRTASPDSRCTISVYGVDTLFYSRDFYL